MFHFWATFLWSSAQQYNKVVPTLTQLSPLTKCQRWSNIGSSILNRRSFFNVVSTLFCPCWNNVNKHMLAQLSFSTKFQRWNNIGSLTLIWRKSIYVVLLLLCQSWNNVDKCKSPQLSFSTKYQHWRSTLFQRWCVYWVEIDWE